MIFASFAWVCVCAKPRKLTTCSISFFVSVGGNHLYVWWFTLRFISLGWLFLLLVVVAHSVHFEKLRSIGWFHFICSFIQIKEFHIFLDSERSFAMVSINGWNCIHSVSNIEAPKKSDSKRKSEPERWKEWTKEKLPTTAFIYRIGIKSSRPQVWKKLRATHTDTHTHKCEYKYNFKHSRFYFSFTSMAATEIFRVKQCVCGCVCAYFVLCTRDHFVISSA